MPTFKDNANREWKIVIDAPSIMRIREECDPAFLLNDSEQNNTYSRMQADPVLLCRVIYLLCEDQRIERGVDEKSFYLEIIGDAIDSATEALLGAIANFTPGATRELLAAVAQKTKEVQRKAMELAKARIDDPKLEERMLAQVKEKLDEVMGESTEQLSAIAAQELSESTPEV